MRNNVLQVAADGCKLNHRCYVIDLSRMCPAFTPERAKPHGLKPVNRGHCGRFARESSRQAKSAPAGSIRPPIGGIPSHVSER
jgi:hypothetical protein